MTCCEYCVSAMALAMTSGLLSPLLLRLAVSADHVLSVSLPANSKPDDELIIDDEEFFLSRPFLSECTEGLTAEKLSRLMLRLGEVDRLVCSSGTPR